MFRTKVLCLAAALLCMAVATADANAECGGYTSFGNGCCSCGFNRICSAYRSIPNSNAEACVAACDADPLCNAFHLTYTNFGARRRCDLLDEDISRIHLLSGFTCQACCESPEATSAIVDTSTSTQSSSTDSTESTSTDSTESTSTDSTESTSTDSTESTSTDSTESTSTDSTESTSTDSTESTSTDSMSSSSTSISITRSSIAPTSSSSASGTSDRNTRSSQNSAPSSTSSSISTASQPSSTTSPKFLPVDSPVMAGGNDWLIPVVVVFVLLLVLVAAVAFTRFRQSSLTDKEERDFAIQNPTYAGETLRSNPIFTTHDANQDNYLEPVGITNGEYLDVGENSQAIYHQSAPSNGLAAGSYSSDNSTDLDPVAESPRYLLFKSTANELNDAVDTEGYSSPLSYGFAADSGEDIEGYSSPMVVRGQYAVPVEMESVYSQAS